MTDIVKWLRDEAIDEGLKNDPQPEIIKRLNEAADRIEQLEKYRALVRFIANDYHELSYEKAQWQRDDWKKRCNKLIQEIEYE